MTRDATELQGRIAIVTGAGSGLGAATARVLAAAGATVVLTGRRPDRLEATAAAIQALGGQAVTAPGDVGDPRAADVATSAAANLGGLDILVNNAGIHAHPRMTADIPVGEFDEYLRIDLRGPFLMMRAALPQMLERGGGAIVNVSSIAGIIGLKYTSAYAAAKGGLVAMTRTAAIDYADRGIRVNCICPAGMEPTDPRQKSEEAQRMMDESYGGSPIGCRAQVDEVAELIRFLVGASAAPITGAVIPVDGGYTAR